MTRFFWLILFVLLNAPVHAGEARTMPGRLEPFTFRYALPAGWKLAPTRPQTGQIRLLATTPEPAYCLFWTETREPDDAVNAKALDALTIADFDNPEPASGTGVTTLAAFIRFREGQPIKEGELTYFHYFNVSCSGSENDKAALQQALDMIVPSLDITTSLTRVP